MSQPASAAKRPTEYFVAFSTKGNDGYIKAVKVTIQEDIVLADETVRIDLADDKLYPALQQYVKGNPR